MNEEGRDDDEEDVGEGVDKLCNIRREGVVVLTPVDRTGAPLSVDPLQGVHPPGYQLGTGDAASSGWSFWG